MDATEIDRLFTLATQREIEAQEFYAAAAAKVADAQVRELFGKLAAEEQKHYDLLTALKAKPKAMRFAAPAGDWKLAEAEALPSLSLAMKPKDAIALAMKKEQQAVEFYRGLAAAARSSATKAMLNQLADMELNHKRGLEAMYVDVAYPEVF